MATGYIVSGRGDLDALFAPRTGAAAANTGYKSNGGVDLAQRFEPRGATAAIAATNFKTGATDLAQVFKDIVSAETFTDHTMVARTSVPVPNPDAYRGFDDGQVTGAALASSTMSPGTTSSWTISALAGTSGLPVQFALRGVTTPTNNDATWKRIEVTGVVEGSGSPGTFTVHRSNSSYTAGGSAGNLWGYWTWNPATGAVINFLPGNSYAVRIYRG